MNTIDAINQYLICDMSTTENKLDRNLLYHKLYELLEVLDDRQIKILAYRYGFVDEHIYKLEDVGKIYGISRQRVQQIQAKAVRILRSRRSLLQKYLVED